MAGTTLYIPRYFSATGQSQSDPRDIQLAPDGLYGVGDEVVPICYLGYAIVLARLGYKWPIRHSYIGSEPWSLVGVRPAGSGAEGLIMTAVVHGQEQTPIEVECYTEFAGEANHMPADQLKACQAILHACFHAPLTSHGRRAMDFVDRLATLAALDDVTWRDQLKFAQLSPRVIKPEFRALFHPIQALGGFSKSASMALLDDRYYFRAGGNAIAAFKNANGIQVSCSWDSDLKRFGGINVTDINTDSVGDNITFGNLVSHNFDTPWLAHVLGFNDLLGGGTPLPSFALGTLPEGRHPELIKRAAFSDGISPADGQPIMDDPYTMAEVATVYTDYPSGAPQGVARNIGPMYRWVYPFQAEPFIMLSYIPYELDRYHAEDSLLLHTIHSVIGEPAGTTLANMLVEVLNRIGDGTNPATLFSLIYDLAGSATPVASVPSIPEMVEVDMTKVNSLADYVRGPLFLFLQKLEALNKRELAALADQVGSAENLAAATVGSLAAEIAKGGK